MKQSYTNIWNRCWAFGLLSLFPFAFANGQGREDVQTLSPFEVSAAEDFGYRVTNAQTTTRIGAPIFETPLNIQVLSEEFLRDTNLGNQIHEVLRYTAATSMDGQMGILQPGTNFTPSGSMTIRGFPVSLRLQDNVFRYIGYNADIVDRIEIVKGPAATFYGKGYPGGVINYVTKSAQLAELPTVFSYRYGTYEDHKVQIDNNTLLRDNMALRTILTLHNAEGQGINEFLHTYTVFNSLRWQINDRLMLTGRFEFHQRKENRNNWAWIWPEEYFQSYQNPSQALIDAHAARHGTAATAEAYRNDIRLNNRFGAWLNSYRDVNPGFTPYYAFNEGPTFNRMVGEMTNGRPHKWNSWGPDDYAQHNIENFNVALDWRAADWLDLRFSVNNEVAVYDEMRAQTRPNADGVTFHTLRGPTWRDYEQNTANYMVDAVISHEIGPLQSKFLLGYIHRTYRSEFGGTLIGTNIYDFRQVPGYPADGAGQTTGPTRANYFDLQGLLDADGNYMTPQQVYQEWNPELHPRPALSVISQTRRTLRDRYIPIEEEAYVSYQGTLWDRLHFSAGFRAESRDPNGGQVMDANPPWLTGFKYQMAILDESQYTAWGLSPAYQQSVITNTRAGDSYMFGAMYEITPEISIYASVSQSYRPNRGRLANWDDFQVRTTVDQWIAENPGQTTFTSGQAEVDRLYNTAPFAANETGDNMELGVKTILWDGKLDMTASIFRLDRANRYVDDSDRSNLREPLNDLTIGGNPVGRLVRWFTNDAFERAEGVEVEAIWTPNPQYQLKVSASNLWQAEVVRDPSLAPTAIQFQRRLPNAPKIRFNVWNKYTFVDGMFDGLSLGGGGRYSSKFEISNTSDQWASNLGGGYLVFDGMASYSTQLMEVPTTFRFNVNNALDKSYSEGGWNVVRGREMFLTAEMRF
jgi:outer membrane receptor protein involved in Fe transport